MIALRTVRWPRTWLALWIGLLLATVVVCLVPLPVALHAPRNIDKLEHALGYLVLALYAANLFAHRGARLRSYLALVLLGAAIEGAQGLTPWRSADPIDLIANVLGIVAGALLGATALGGVLARVDARLA